MKLGLHFSCASAKGGDWPELYESAIRQAEIGDKLGIDCAVVAEHHFTADGWIPTPMLLASAIAARTTRIKVGPNIIILPFYNPVSVAEQILVLDNLSGGRAVAGLGAGARESEFGVFGAPYRKRFRRTEEALDAVRRVMATVPASYEGEHYQFDEVTVYPRPVGPRPPVWYGAISIPGAKRAARFADALVIGPALDAGKAAEVADTYREECDALGQEAGEVILRREGYVGPTDTAAWETALSPLEFLYSKVYTHFAGEDSAGMREYAESRFMVGGSEEIIQQSEQYRSVVGADSIVIRMQLPGLENQLAEEATARLGQDVLPRVAHL